MELMRNEYSTFNYDSQHLNISLGPFARDERVDRIEHLLELLIEGRFGNGHLYQKLETPFSMTWDEFVNYDLMPISRAMSIFGCCVGDQTADPVGGDENSLDSKPVFQWSEIRAGLHSPSPLARGSPAS